VTGVDARSDAGARRVVPAAVGFFLLTRLLTLVAAAVAADRAGRPLLDVLVKADGLRYLSIVADGYDPVPELEPDGTFATTTNLVFFPLYPALVRALAWAGDDRVVAVLVSVAAGAAAAGLMASWAREAAGDRGAVAAVALWCVWPSSVVLSMAYSEALFAATVAGCLLAMQRGRWWWAATACAFAGLTRPTGAALLLALVVGVLVARLRPRTAVPVLALGASGLAVSLGHVAIVTGRWDGWLWLESTVWRSGFDGGAGFLGVMREVLTGGPAAGVPVYVVATGTALLALVLLVALLRTRPPAREATYTVAALVLGLGGAAYAHVKPRFLLVALPLFVEPGRWVGRAPRAVLWVAGAALVALSAWWSAYLLVTWPYSI
jgi:hypothetical protein